MQESRPMLQYQLPMLQVTAGAIELLVDDSLRATIGAEASIASSALSVSSGSSFDISASDYISAKTGNVSLQQQGQPACALVSLTLTWSTMLTFAKGRQPDYCRCCLECIWQCSCSVANTASVLADSVQLQALEKVELSSARISVDAGRTIDVYAAQSAAIQAGNVTATADNSLQVFGGESIGVVTSSAQITASQNIDVSTSALDVKSSRSLHLTSEQVKVASADVDVSVGDQIDALATGSVSFQAKLTCALRKISKLALAIFL